MDRRDFLRAGTVLGLAGVGGTATLPERVQAEVRRAAKRRSADPIRLSSNENPLGLSPAAREAVKGALDRANRYPGAWAGKLREKLAERLGVTPDHMVLGAGSTEVLQMAVQAAASPRERLVVADPTFEDVPRYQRPFAFELEKVPLAPDYSHDLGAMREIAEGARRPSVVYLCSPNNPTGTLTACSDIDAWIGDAPQTTFFIVDEAYFEYVDDPSYWSMLKWVDDRPNVLVVRTFSKIYGMAGLRLGYGVAHPDTAERLREFMCANNANQLAVAAAMASLDDEELISRSLAVNQAAFEIVRPCLEELGLKYLPTSTNFVMHRIHGDLEEYIDRMLEHGIRVGRPFPPMLEWNRLSFGLPDEMERWSETVRTFRKKGWI